MKWLICLLFGHKEVWTEVNEERAAFGGHLGSWFYSVGYCERCDVSWDWRDAHEAYMRERGGLWRSSH